MSNFALKTAGVMLALLALTGCNQAEKTIEGKIGQAVNEGVKNDQAARNGGGESGSKTDINECLKGCGYLSGAGMFSKEFCSDSCWAAVAGDTKDLTICETKVDPKNDLVQASCRMSVAEKTLNPKDCDGIGATSDDMLRISCYLNVAKAKKDPSVCDLIASAMFKTSCVEDATKTE